MGHLECPLCLRGDMADVKGLQEMINSVLTRTLHCPICSEQLSGLVNYGNHLNIHLPIGHYQQLELMNSCSQNHEVQNNLQSSEKSDNIPSLETLDIRDIRLSEDVSPTRSDFSYASSNASSLSSEHHDCDACGLVFSSAHFLLLHKVAIHKISTDFSIECKSCNRKFDNLETYQGHMKQYHNKKTYVCDLCPKTFKLKGSLAVHNRMYHDGSPSVCLICNRKFPSKTRKDFHERRCLKGSNSEKFKFENDNSVCGSNSENDIRGGIGGTDFEMDGKYPKMMILPDIHRLKDCNNEKIVNDNNVMSFEELMTLVDLKNPNSNVPLLDSSPITPNLVCTTEPTTNLQSATEFPESSPVTLVNQSAILSNTSRDVIHENSEQLLKKTSNNVSIQMTDIKLNEQIRENNSNLSQIKVQIMPNYVENVQQSDPKARAVTKPKITKSKDNSSMEVKLWECDVCKKSFTTKYFLKKHKRLHTGETPYRCAECGKCFTFQQSYHKHILYHSDEKPHQCSYCGRTFKELSTLHNHVRIHTGEKPFVCQTCGKAFRQKVSYLVHSRIHTGVTPYGCENCNKSFRYKVSLRSHKCEKILPSSHEGSVNSKSSPGIYEQFQKEAKELESVESTSRLTSMSEAFPSGPSKMHSTAEKEFSPLEYQTENHSTTLQKDSTPGRGELLNSADISDKVSIVQPSTLDQMSGVWGGSDSTPIDLVDTSADIDTDSFFRNLFT